MNEAGKPQPGHPLYDSKEHRTISRKTAVIVSILYIVGTIILALVVLYVSH